VVAVWAGYDADFMMVHSTGLDSTIGMIWSYLKGRL